MSERDGHGDALCRDAAPDFIPPRASRGRRSGVVLPGGGGQDTDTILLESVRAAPRRSSIIKCLKTVAPVAGFVPYSLRVLAVETSHLLVERHGDGVSPASSPVLRLQVTGVMEAAGGSGLGISLFTAGSHLSLRPLWWSVAKYINPSAALE
ncbi:unnamed protein product [Pleuronectes platessa]|uniref:Uncharacterized protein n=1 Tax=Pleuronectes platessa TaxID=8262 RepID=A0A9N7V9J1_PLEPL|nr:unnamed protein product [Pleuronectes platessa]